MLGQTSSHAKAVLLVFLFLWSFVFGAFIGTSAWVSAPEQHTVRLRTYGHASTTLVYQVFGFASSFYGPYMLNAQYGNMGLNVAYFHAGEQERVRWKLDVTKVVPGLTFVMSLLVLLLVPETARLTLEQIDEYYLSGRAAWRTSINRNKKIANGKVVDHTGEHDYNGQKPSFLVTRSQYVQTTGVSSNISSPKR